MPEGCGRPQKYMCELNFLLIYINFLLISFYAPAIKCMKESKWTCAFPESGSYMKLLLSLTPWRCLPHTPRLKQKNQPTWVPVFTLKHLFRIPGGNHLLSVLQETLRKVMLSDADRKCYFCCIFCSSVAKAVPVTKR